MPAAGSRAEPSGGGRDPWPDRVNGHFHLPRLAGALVIAVLGAGLLLSGLGDPSRAGWLAAAMGCVSLALAYAQVCIALPSWAGPTHFAPGFPSPLGFAARGFRRATAYREVLAIEHLWASTGPASLKVSLRSGDRFIMDIQGKRDIAEALIGELVVARAAEAGATITRTGRWFHDPHSKHDVEVDMKSARFSMVFIWGIGAIGAITMVTAVEAIARGDNPLSPAFMVTIALFLSGLFVWLFKQVGGYVRTGGLAEVRDGSVYLQLYDEGDPRRCWVPLGDILLLHHGSPGVASAEVEAVEAKLAYRLSRKQRLALLLPQWYYAYFVTRAKFHRIHATYIPDPAELRRAWLEAHDAVGDRPVTRAGRVRLIDGDLESVGYVAPERVLEVEFRSGGFVRFDGVPLVVYEEFVRSPLPWQYFKEKIHSRYPSRAVG
jgi:hypothetical protein